MAASRDRLWFDPERQPLGGISLLMFLGRVKLITLAGFTVWVDASWLIFAALITWTLAVGVFPSTTPGFPPITYWWMGIAGAIGVFASIVVHEFSHSIVARQYSLPITGITLFIFGGVAELHREPENSRSEFWMAVAGPLSSMVLGAALLLAATAAGPAAPRPIFGLLSWLGTINWVLALFNLVPAFPLDGGRVLRSLLWAWKGDFEWATRIATGAGSGFGLLLIVLGVFSAFHGQFVNGIWLFLIGMFLQISAGAARRQLALKRAFSGRSVSTLMNGQSVSVSPDISLKSLVENYFYRYRLRTFPVLRNGALVGCVSAAKLRRIDKAQWDNLHVGDAAEPCSPDTTISLQTDALEALMKMQRMGREQLFVVADGQYRGTLTLADMLQFLAVYREIERKNAA